MGYQSYWDRRDSSNSANWRNPNTPQGQANIRYENRLYDAQSRGESRSSSNTCYSGGNSGTGYKAVEASAPNSAGFWAFLDKVGEVTETVLEVGAVVIGSVIVLGVAGEIMQNMSSESERKTTTRTPSANSGITTAGNARRPKGGAENLDIYYQEGTSCIREVTESGRGTHPELSNKIASGEPPETRLRH